MSAVSAVFTRPHLRGLTPPQAVTVGLYAAVRCLVPPAERVSITRVEYRVMTDLLVVYLADTGRKVEVPRDLLMTSGVAAAVMGAGLVAAQRLNEQVVW